MEKRLLGRGQGRTDDNVETIKKRFKVTLSSFNASSLLSQFLASIASSAMFLKVHFLPPHTRGSYEVDLLALLACPHMKVALCLQVFLDSSMPVVNHYDGIGKVYKFKSDRSAEDIYSEVRQLFLDL